MKNYFYDVLPVELQQYIIKIEEVENRKGIIKNVYTPWLVRCQKFNNSYEEYRHTDMTINNKIWYFDSTIIENQNGGIGYLRSSDKHRVILRLYEVLDMVDVMEYTKRLKVYKLPKKVNKNMIDIGYDMYVGNYWKSGYTPLAQDYLDISNDSYDLGILL